MTTAIDQLQQMKEKYNYVSSKTDAMNQACEKLLEDQVRTVCLEAASESIVYKVVKYFQKLSNKCMFY